MGVRRWLMRTGMPPAKQFTKELKGSEREELYCRYSGKSRAVGAKKTGWESKKAKAFWASKALKDREEEFHDPARKDNIWDGNRQYWSGEKSTSKTQS